MLTVKEANEKWCPMVRIARRETPHEAGGGMPAIVGGCNTDALGRNRIPASCTCIADKCAMWMWIGDFNLDTCQYNEPTHGYCGLAGKP
jgi:hypothetical protein